jgi:hypothetical protein
VSGKDVRAGEVTTTATAFVRMRPTGGTTYTYYTVAVPVVDTAATATPTPETTPISPVPTGTVPTLNPDGSGTSGTGTGTSGTGTTGNNGTLPATGGDILIPSALGLLLLLGGGAFTIVWFNRRRKVV